MAHRYTYDFGDSWHHVVEIEDIAAPDTDTRRAVCVADERACPPGDCGGVPADTPPAIVGTGVPEGNDRIGSLASITHRTASRNPTSQVDNPGIMHCVSGPTAPRRRVGVNGSSAFRTKRIAVSSESLCVTASVRYPASIWRTSLPRFSPRNSRRNTSGKSVTEPVTKSSRERSDPSRSHPASSVAASPYRSA